MSMANKCDRCGKLFELELTSVPDISITKYRHPYEDEKLDLCEECQKELEKWLEEGQYKCIYYHEGLNSNCWAYKGSDCPYDGDEEKCHRYPR